MTINELKW